MHIFFSKRNPLPLYGLVIGVLWVLFSSCGSTRQLIYMQGQFDTTALSKVNIKEPIIQKGDILSIVVYSDNPEATKIYNQSVITGATASSATATSGGASAGGGITGGGGLSGASPSGGGYMVDEQGNIEFQGLGLIHVDSMTRARLKDTLSARLKDFLVNPYYSIRFLNFRFTMLGEISRPGVFSIPGDHISLLEALGMAGDMTFYGRRDNILVVRETLGKREWARLDITKPEIMASPYFYLQPNDVVIVEPTRKKIAATDQTAIRNITIAGTVISTLALLYTIFK